LQKKRSPASPQENVERFNLTLNPWISDRQAYSTTSKFSRLGLIDLDVTHDALSKFTTFINFRFERYS